MQNQNIPHYHYCRTCEKRTPCPLKGCENKIPTDTCLPCQDRLIEQGMAAIGARA